jgi:hypothetical protein
MKIESKYLLACLLLFLLAAVATYSGRLWSEMGDSWEHAASVQELASNFRNPSNPFLAAEGSTTPRYTLYILLLALAKKISGLPLIDLMELAGMFNLLLLVTGIYVFARAYTRNSHQPFFTLITLLLFWGHGWLYSSEYSLQFLTSSLFHPSIFAFSLSFWGWYCFLAFKERKTGTALPWTVLLSLLITSTHPLTASFYFIVMFLLNFHQKKEMRPGFYLIGLAFLLSLLLMLFWPYFSIIETFKKGALSGGWYPTGNYFYSNIISGAGLSLLGIPIAAYYLFCRKHLCIIVGLIISVFIYLASYAANLPLLGRYVYFAIFFLQLLLSLYLAELWCVPPSGASASLARKLLKGASVAIVILLFIYQIQLMDLIGMLRCCVHVDPKFSIGRCSHPKEKYAFLATHLKPGNVVMSDTFTSWVIPAMTGAKVVSLFHDNPLVPDNAARMNDTKNYFSPGTSQQDRMEIVKRYGATHLLIHKGLEKFEYAPLLQEWGIFVPVFNPDLIGSLASLGTVIFRDDTYILARL